MVVTSESIQADESKTADSNVVDGNVIPQQTSPQGTSVPESTIHIQPFSQQRSQVEQVTTGNDETVSADQTGVTCST